MSKKSAGKCNNVFRTDFVDDAIEITGGIKRGMSAVVKLQVFRPIRHVLFSKSLLMFFFEQQAIVFGIVFGESIFQKPIDLVVDNLPHPGTFRLRAFKLHGKGLLIKGIVLHLRMDVYPVRTAFVLADDLPERLSKYFRRIWRQILSASLVFRRFLYSMLTMYFSSGKPKRMSRVTDAVLAY